MLIKFEIEFNYLPFLLFKKLYIICTVEPLFIREFSPILSKPKKGYDIVPFSHSQLF